MKRSESLASAAFVGLALLLAPLYAAPRRGTETSTPVTRPREYRLRLYHTHTGERIDIVYRRGGKYLPDALAQLDHFLRDHRTGEVHHYSPGVFDLLVDLTAQVGHPGAEYQIICGYRTPWSNNYLRSHSTGVAEHSLHMQAEAIDVRLPGTTTEELRKAALSLHRGGVGYYPRSEFVHVDVGRVRQWCFGCATSTRSGD